jgi:hypothetical protein
LARLKVQRDPPWRIEIAARFLSARRLFGMPLHVSPLRLLVEGAVVDLEIQRARIAIRIEGKAVRLRPQGAQRAKGLLHRTLGLGRGVERAPFEVRTQHQPHGRSHFARPRMRAVDRQLHGIDPFRQR